MPRNRVIYQSEGVYVSKAAHSIEASDHYQLDRIQSANYSFNITRQDVSQFGGLSRIDSIVLESPTVSLDFSYYLTDGANETALGFNVAKSGTATLSQFPSGQLISENSQNFYIVTASEGKDLNSENGSNLTGKPVIGIGNAYLTDYTVDLSVGSIPTVSVSMEGANMNASLLEIGNSCKIPAINQENGTKISGQAYLYLPNSHTGSSKLNALRPGDVTVSFGLNSETAGTTNLSDLHIQSASLSLPLGRSPIERLGSKFAFARTVDFPINATLTINGIQSESASGNLVDLIQANPKQDITITVKKPGSSETAVLYKMKNAQLDSLGLSSSIGSNKTVDLTFSTQIGAINDSNNGIQMSGSYTDNSFIGTLASYPSTFITNTNLSIESYILTSIVASWKANNSNIKSVYIGNTVTGIGSRSFESCDNLSRVTIPDSVTSIGDYAFYNCSSLTSVTIGNGVTSIGNWAFQYCSSLTSVTIGNGVTSIGDWAFQYCSSLTSVTIPNSVTSIGEGAFFDCYGLTSVTIPNSVTSIGSSAFFNCYGLTSVTIGNGVTSIGDSAFYACSSLTSVTIPNSVTSIGSSAFFYCSSLTAFTVDALNSNYSSMNGVLFNKSQSTLVAYPAGKTGSYTIPNGVTSIGDSAFYACSSLTSVTIPNSVTSIGDGAFYACSSLTSVTIPNNVTSIGDGVFSYCSKLATINCYVGKDVIDQNSNLVGIPVPLTIYARSGDNTWTAGPDTVGGKPVTVVKNLS